jgi:hypothetical protein
MQEQSPNVVGHTAETAQSYVNKVASSSVTFSSTKYAWLVFDKASVCDFSSVKPVHVEDAATRCNTLAT